MARLLAGWDTALLNGGPRLLLYRLHSHTPASVIACYCFDCEDLFVYVHGHRSSKDDESLQGFWMGGKSMMWCIHNGVIWLPAQCCYWIWLRSLIIV